MRNFASMGLLVGLSLIAGSILAAVAGGHDWSDIGLLLMFGIAITAGSAVLLSIEFTSFKNIGESGISNLQVCAGLMLMGNFGLNLLGIALGISTGEEEDAWVFGF